MNRKTALSRFKDRCFALRVTPTAVRIAARVSSATMSRWNKDPTSIRASTLLKLERVLDKMEAGE